MMAESLDVAELEGQLDEEVLCQFGPEVHPHDAACPIVAAYRLTISCPPAFSVFVCRVIATVNELTPEVPCAWCGRPTGDCWVVTEL